MKPILCHGHPREMGRAQGTALSREIIGLREDLARLEAFRLQQPAWMPYPVFRWFAQARAGRYLARAFRQDQSGMKERLEGIATGAEVSRGTISLFNALEPFLSSVGGCIACGHACSVLAVRGSRSATDEPVIAHNFDYLPLVQPYYVLRESRPASGFRSLDFTVAPLAGAIDGLNEAGLAITYDYGYALDEPSSPAPSISMAISGALQRCRTVEDAASFVTRQPHWGAGLLMLADAAGDMASLELSSTRSHLRRPETGEDSCLHTNRLRSAIMREIEAPEDAVLDRRAPAALRGSRLHESADRREERLRFLVAQRERFGLDDIAAVMADHGPDGQGNASTLCMHSDYWNTTACVQLMPKSRRLRISIACACQARYETFGL